MMTDLAYHRRVERSRKLVIFCTLMAPIYMTSFVMRRRQDHVFSIDPGIPSPGTPSPHYPLKLYSGRV